MRHMMLPRFWRHYRQLPKEVQDLADKNFKLLKTDPYHPSLHFKKVAGKSSCGQYASETALGTEKPDGILWFWIGTHSEYNTLL